MWVLDKYRIYKNKKSYEKNAVLGKDIAFGVSGNCFNESKKKEHIRIGDCALMMGSLYVADDGKIEIGKNFYFGGNSMIGAINSVKVGDCVIISNDVKIFDNNNHPTSPTKRKIMSIEGFQNENWHWRHADNKEIVIEDNVWIGQYATILKGVRIGKGAIIGTKAVVTKDVPPYTIVAGNPARVVKKIEEETF